jgi:hypothetical protein
MPTGRHHDVAMARRVDVPRAIANSAKERVRDRISNREANDGDSTWAKYATEFVKRRAESGDVFEHAQADEGIERFVSEWHLEQRGLAQISREAELPQHPLHPLGVAVNV